MVEENKNSAELSVELIDNLIKDLENEELKLLCLAEKKGQESLESSISRDIDRIRLTTKLLKNLLYDFAETKQFKVRVNQLQAVKDLVTFLKNAKSDLKGYFVQPTGAGKTILMGIITRLLDVPTLVLVPNSNLLYQTKEEFASIPGISEDEIGLFGDKKTEIDKKITVCTYQSLRKLRAYSNTDYGLIIADEVHKSLGDLTQENLSNITSSYDGDEDIEIDFADIETYVPKQGLHIGFTATPDLKDKSVDDYYGNLISRVSYKNMVESGALVKFKVLHTEGNIYSEDFEDGLTEEKECMVLEREACYEKLLNKFLVEREKKGHIKTAVFCVNGAECLKFQELAKSKGLKSELITSKQNADSELIKRSEMRMNNGDLDMIITVKKLGEGWNYPALEAVILARATMSPAMILQPAGRAARAYNGKDRALIFETFWKRVKSGASSKTGIYSDDSEDEVGGGKNSERNGEEKNKENNSVSFGKKPYSLIRALYENGEIDLEDICEGENGEMIDFVTHEKAPDGWVTNFALAKSLGKAPDTIARIADEYRSAPCGWFKPYLDKINKSCEHYSPELVAVISKLVAKIKKNEATEKAPNGWVTNKALAKTLVKAPDTITEIANKYRSDHSDWFKLYLNEQNQSCVHYSPELVALISKLVAEIKKNEATEKAPNGWVTKTALAKNFGKDPDTIARIADKYRSHCDWFKPYLDKINNSCEHYSPELVALISKLVTEIKKNEATEKAPNGWVTNFALAKTLGKDPDTIARIADKYRSEHSDWFKLYLNEQNKSCEHFSPELVGVIINQNEATEKAPNGWATNRNLAKTLGKGHHTIARIADKYRSEHSDWFKLYLNEQNQSCVHYSPELVALISKLVTEIKQNEATEKAPNGWVTNFALAKTLGKDPDTIARIADKYRNHCDWFKLCLDKTNHSYEHYSPELVALISKLVAEKK